MEQKTCWNEASAATLINILMLLIKQTNLLCMLTSTETEPKQKQKHQAKQQGSLALPSLALPALTMATANIPPLGNPLETWNQASGSNSFWYQGRSIHMPESGIFTIKLNKAKI